MTNEITSIATYNLKASNGRHIRMATKVTFEDGYKVEFMELMPKRAAAVQAKEIEAKTRRR